MKPTACSTWDSTETSCGLQRKCKKERQTLLFSATMPDRIETLSKDLLNNPVTVKLALSKPAEKIKQGAYVLFDHQKDDVLVELLKERNVKSGIVFTSQKTNGFSNHSNAEESGHSMRADFF